MDPSSATSPSERSTATATAPGEAHDLIPDDVDLGFGDLPPGFWDAPPEEVRASLEEGATVTEPKRAGNEAPAAKGARSLAKPEGRARVADPERDAGASAAQDATGPVAAEPAASEPAASEPAASDDADGPTPLEAAFDQLQSLFPGRVVEVIPREPEGETAAAESPLDDGFPAPDGYDDDEQAPLSFGPADG